MTYIFEFIQDRRRRWFLWRQRRRLVKMTKVLRGELSGLGPMGYHIRKKYGEFLAAVYNAIDVLDNK